MIAPDFFFKKVDLWNISVSRLITNKLHNTEKRLRFSPRIAHIQHRYGKLDNKMLEAQKQKKITG